VKKNIEDPILTSCEEGYIDLTWENRVYATLEESEETKNDEKKQIRCIITSFHGPLPSDIKTEIIKYANEEFVRVCDLMANLIV
jgi:hypothetical protein